MTIARPLWCVSLLGAALPLAAEQTCVATDQSTEQILPGVTVQWDSSFLCANAPDSDTYKFEVRVTRIGGGESVTIEQMLLTHRTPRPRGRTPAGSKTGDTLPLTVAAGESKTFLTTGTYVLVVTDEGKKANHHYRAAGAGDATDRPFFLGINVRFRAPGVGE